MPNIFESLVHATKKRLFHFLGVNAISNER
nr:MAG TPA: hypothetical protein [Caudoviricetes sp.]